MNADGTGQTELTSGPGFRIAPYYSPNDDRIVFMKFPDFSSAPDIWVSNADGSNEVNITNSPAFDGCPRWSPVDDRT